MNQQRTTDRPVYAHSSAGARIATAFAAVTISSMLIGGVLGLFESRSGRTIAFHPVSAIQHGA